MTCNCTLAHNSNETNDHYERPAVFMRRTTKTTQRRRRLGTTDRFARTLAHIFHRIHVVVCFVCVCCGPDPIGLRRVRNGGDVVGLVGYLFGDVAQLSDWRRRRRRRCPCYWCCWRRWVGSGLRVQCWDENARVQPLRVAHMRGARVTHRHRCEVRSIWSAWARRRRRRRQRQHRPLTPRGPRRRNRTAGGPL